MKTAFPNVNTIVAHVNLRIQVSELTTWVFQFWHFSSSHNFPEELRIKISLICASSCYLLRVLLNYLFLMTQFCLQKRRVDYVMLNFSGHFPNFVYLARVLGFITIKSCGGVVNILSSSSSHKNGMPLIGSSLTP